MVSSHWVIKVPPSVSAAVQLPDGLHMMLPGVHFHSILPVHLHLPPSLSAALQLPHGH
ncbi:hypothetical protein K443DRAFT_193420 [Laccaria amethystina LaAM-08-1]|uniref:Uncharacterized protein n=1 Tax=Laccaria amethystina LaAM-08-1 TaxID=1095629 RepID=A0A0C9XSC8_9AGAR|nr:hypothetical protein K443DRAFT_193420 [Laccaria amethystina LaAM-08-1]